MMKNKTFVLGLLLLISMASFGQGENIFVDLEFKKDKWIHDSENLIITQNGVTADRSAVEATLVTKAVAVGFDSIESFIAVSFSCKGQGLDLQQIHFHIRTADSKGWSDWQVVQHAHELAPESSRFVSQLLFFDHTCEQVQLMIEFIDGHDKIPVLESMRLNLFNPGKDKEAPKDIKQQKNINDGCYCPLPDFYNRNEWGCPDGIEPSCSWPSYTNVSHLVVHHSATPNTSSNWPDVVLSFWDYHVNSHGWCDIGYNWLIDPDGNLYEGRGGGDNVKGAHFSCANAYTLGVCVIGDFTDTVPTQEAKDQLVRLLAWKSCNKELSPIEIVYHSPTELDLPTVCGHRDANESTASGACPYGTACPGDSLYPQLEEIRLAVDSLMNVQYCGGPPPPANDSCSFAQALEFSPEPVYVTANVTGATPGGLEAPECSEYNGYPALEDVWFSFVADTTAMGVKVLPSDMFDPVLAIYNDCQGEVLGCSDLGGGVGHAEYIDYYDYVVGETYYIRVYHYGQLSPLTPEFDICLSAPFYYPQADFEAVIAQGPAPFSVDFIDLSLYEPTTWRWTFEGAVPDTSLEENPTGIVFEEPGRYDVSLWVSNENGENEILKKDYIEVEPNSIDTYTSHPVKIFPNPSTGKVSVTSEQEIQTIEFIDSHGKVIQRIEQPAGTTTTDLSTYSDGMYVVKVYLNDKPLTFRVLLKSSS